MVASHSVMMSVAVYQAFSFNPPMHPVGGINLER